MVFVSFGSVGGQHCKICIDASIGTASGKLLLFISLLQWLEDLIVL